MLLAANNLMRQRCAEDFIAMKGTQTIVRKLIGILHDKRERHASSELLQQDLLWTLAPLSSRGYKYNFLQICRTHTKKYVGLKF